MYISTPSQGDVNFTINIVGGNSISGTVSNATPYVYGIADSGYSSFVQDPATTSRVTSDKGYIINADSPIYVSVRLNAGGNAQAGALVSKGENALGTTFRIGTYDNQGNPGSNYLNFFSFMATEDNTTVNLTNERVTSGLQIQNAGAQQFPINNISLNRGQTYVVAVRPQDTNENRAGLIGTLVSSDKPIVVNSGSANGSFGNGNARDYGIDQIVELSKVGKEYIFVKGDGDNSFENVLVVAHEDNTEVSVNGTAVATINAGYYYIAEGNFYTDDNMYVSTSKDVFVYQGIGGTSSEANQGMFFVPPLSCGSRGDVDNIPLIDRIGDREFDGGITIVTRDGAEVLINNLSISNQPAGIDVDGPSTVDGKATYVTYRVIGLTGNVSVNSSNELYVSYFNQNGAAASGSFFSGFASNPLLNLDLTASKLGSCISNSGTSNVVLEVSNNGNFDSLEWQKKNTDDTWSSISGENNSQFTPSEIGTYRVKAVISCDGDTAEYFSSEIPISQCPDDFDSDGIIDNIDLDHDNDGILNSVESKGIGNIDFSNTTSPVINLSDETVLNNIISGSIEKTNENHSVTGQNNSFEMKVAAGVDQELKYILTFTENLNINIKNNPGVSDAIQNGASFVIKSSPASSNITLLDPNDNLLVDTNFDDDFESNVTEFTSNEIRFKFNTNSTTIIDYELFATKVDGITFTHKYSTTETADSQFTPLVYVYDYKNDSDGDGNEDMFERDSDNDGCDDIIEADFSSLENYQGDPDGDGVYGTGSQTFDNGNVTERGLIKVHNDANGYDTEPKKDPNNNYLFQIAGSPAVIQNQPQSTSGCEGSTVEFEVTATSDSGELGYQWQFYNLADELWTNLDDNDSYSGTKTEKLTLSSITKSMDGRYRVLVNSEYYLCGTESDPNVNLTVNAAPDDPIVNQIQTFCQTDTPTISNLVASNNSTTLTLNWYESEDATTPLDSTVELTHNTTYYAEFVDQEGCVSVTRTPSKAFISNPILSASNEVICSGEGFTLTIDNVAKTASDFAAENDLIFITNNGVPVTWNSTTYGNTYFLIQAGTGQDGFSPIDWTTARDLTNSFNSGDSNTSARMYIVENAEMEQAVWDGLNSMGLTFEASQSQIYFWLGLYQDLDDPNYQEPGDESQNYAGWKWVNGQDLKDTYVNWWTGEPNDAGDEHYAQFEFSNNGRAWNDMSIGNGQSWPLFEYLSLIHI